MYYILEWAFTFLKESNVYNLHNPENIYVCSIVKAELYYGAMRTRNPIETLQAQKEFLNNFSSLPFNDEATEHYGKIRATLAAKGEMIGPNDLLIAAIALANQVTTHNTREFNRVSVLIIEDWQLYPDVVLKIAQLIISHFLMRPEL